MVIHRPFLRHLWSDLWSKSKENIYLYIGMECRPGRACLLSFMVKFVVKFPGGKVGKAADSATLFVFFADSGNLRTFCTPSLVISNFLSDFPRSFCLLSANRPDSISLVLLSSNSSPNYFILRFKSP